MKRSFILLLVIIAIFQIRTTSANNIRLEGIVKVTEVNGNIATLEFPLKWDNAWRDSYNWDAIWLFLKYKKAGGNWTSLELEETGHTLAANDGKTYTCLPGKTNDKTTGLFILLNQPTTCNPSLICRLKWKLPEGLTQETFENNNAFILAQGIEMVYVPYGAYQPGDETTEGAFTPVIIDNEENRDMTTNDNSSEKIGLTAGYPKGCQGDSEANCTKYGGLYEWWEVICNGKCNNKLITSNAQNLSLSSESQLVQYGAKMVPGSSTQVQGICPDGWHLPSNTEWSTLSTIRPGWQIQLGGYRNGNGGSFEFLNSYDYWWSSTPSNEQFALFIYLNSSTNIGMSFNSSVAYRSNGMSVRCIRN